MYNEYEGRTRECDNCGHHTNVHSFCSTCEMTICESCDHTCFARCKSCGKIAELAGPALCVSCFELEQIAAPRRCANCHNPARWDSIYCSDRCRQQFLSFAEVA